MRNIRLTIEYDGTNYRGWQVQRQAHGAGRRADTIQETIEKALRKILQEKTRLIASGRTDAGVHAWAQVANFKTNSGIPQERLQKALNGLLPGDIAVSKAEEVKNSFHARFDAKSKIYRYTILNRPYRSAFSRNRVYFYPYPLDVGLMRKEAMGLVGKHDFKSFQATDKKRRGSVRRIKRLKITKEESLIYIDIEAEGFLYNMARNIVGTLIEIGRGKMAKGSLKKILFARNRRVAGPTAPACGLCLLGVKY